MSPGLKSVITADGPGVEHAHLRQAFDVILPFVGVRMPVHLAQPPPVRTVTRAAATVFETFKLLLSATCTMPPLVCRVTGPLAGE